MITIGITDCSKWKNYFDWFTSETVEVIKLSFKENNVNDVEKCDGIVLSGGEDVHPKYYGHPEWMDKKEELKLEVNEVRDEFEMKVIDKAVKTNKPILGICRGLQIVRVQVVSCFLRLILFSQREGIFFRKSLIACILGLGCTS